jgi:hypothetical protein
MGQAALPYGMPARTRWLTANSGTLWHYRHQLKAYITAQEDSKSLSYNLRKIFVVYSNNTV